MAGILFGSTKTRERSANSLITQNIRKYVNKETLAIFTPESKHQIAVLEEELFNLHCQHQETLKKQNEIVFLLHDLILQEKYLELNAEKRELESLAETEKTPGDIERESIITEGLAAIIERRDLMRADLEKERQKDAEEEAERNEYYNRMKTVFIHSKAVSLMIINTEWEAMKMENFHYIPKTSNSNSGPITQNNINTKPKSKNQCIVI